MFKTTLNVLQFSTADVHKFLRNAVLQTMSFTKSKIGCIYICQHQGNFSIKRFSLDKSLKKSDIALVQPCSVLKESQLWKSVLYSKEAFYENTISDDTKLNLGFSQDEKLQSILGVPVFEQSKLVLVLVLANASDSYSSESAEQLSLLMRAAWKILKNQDDISQEIKSEEHLSHLLTERIKEMECTLAVSNEIQKNLPEKLFFNSLVDKIKQGFMHPDHLKVRIQVDGQIYGNQDLSESLSGMSAVLSESDNHYGIIELGYEKEVDFIFPEEQNLLNNIAQMVSRWLETSRAKELIRKSEEKLSITLQSIGDGVVATDIHGRVNRMNKVAEALTGITLKEAWGKQITEVFKIVNAESREVVVNPVEKVLKTGKIVGLSNHTVLISASGKEYQISDSAAPIRNKKNEIEGMILVFSDVTAQYVQQAKIAESERRFKSFFNTVPGAVSITEIATGKYVDVNTTFENMSGYKRKELIGKTSLEINIWEKVSDRENFVKNLLTEKQVNNYEANFRAKNGNIIHGLATANTIKIDGNDYIILIVIDVTELFATRKNLLKYNSALAQLPTSVIITDLEFIIEYANPIVGVLTAYTSEQLIGQPLKMLYANDYFETRIEQIKKQLLEGKVWSDEFQNKRSDGSFYWLSINISGVYDDKHKLVNFTIVEQDITKDKLLHDQLVKSKEKAEASDRLKTAFMNNISHEIRTPLNSILGFGELLLNTNDFSLEERKKYLSILKNSSRRLTDTITDYMDVSLISSGNMEVKNKVVHLNKLIREVYDCVFSLHQSSSLEFKLLAPQHASVEIETDGELLKKILVHLAINAFKFTKSGSVKIGFEIEEEHVRLFVDDTGVGIDESQQQEVFGFFQQENIRLTRGHEGSGLGLSIVKGLADLLGFSIQMQSAKHQGTKINLFLPKPKNEMSKVNPLKSDTIKSSIQEKPCILIAEDEDTNFYVLDLFLRKAFSITTVRALNGVEAIDVCRENPAISLVLMDIKMPVLDGIEATKQIKARRPELPIIAVTAYALSGDEQKLLQAGCDDYIAKPLRKAELLLKINRFVRLT